MWFPHQDQRYSLLFNTQQKLVYFGFSLFLSASVPSQNSHSYFCLCSIPMLKRCSGFFFFLVHINFNLFWMLNTSTQFQQAASQNEHNTHLMCALIQMSIFFCCRRFFLLLIACTKASWPKNPQNREDLSKKLSRNSLFYAQLMGWMWNWMDGKRPRRRRIVEKTLKEKGRSRAQ